MYVHETFDTTVTTIYTEMKGRHSLANNVVRLSVFTVTNVIESGLFIAKIYSVHFLYASDLWEKMRRLIKNTIILLDTFGIFNEESAFINGLHCAKNILIVFA